MVFETIRFGRSRIPPGGILPRGVLRPAGPSDDRGATTMTTAEAPHWRGINHLAMVTPDMDATVRFYHGVLGMRLVATTHGGADAALLLRDRSREHDRVLRDEGDPGTFAKPAGMPPTQAIQFDHLSFNLPDEQALIDLQKQLADAGCECTEMVDHGFVHSVYFTDPNGIALEASWWALDATGRARRLRRPTSCSGPRPVPAVLELRNAGSAARPCRPTQLVSEEIVDPV